MNKKISALLLAVSMITSVNAANNNLFVGLTPSIKTSAKTWITNFVSKLDATQQLMYLNLFIQPSLNSVEAAMKCMQSIQEDKALTATSEDLALAMQKVIELYITHMQKKFE